MATGPPAEWCAKVRTGWPASAAHSCSGRRVGGIERGEHFSLVVEAQHVAVAVDPAGPLVAEQCHEAAGLVEAPGLALDLVPHLGMRIEREHAPVVVIGEGGDVEPGDVARVPEVVVRRAGSIREVRVPVQIAPQHARSVARDQKRVALGRKAVRALGAQPDDPGLARDRKDRLAPAIGGRERDARRELEPGRPLRKDDLARRRGPRVALPIEQRERDGHAFARARNTRKRHMRAGRARAGSTSTIGRVGQDRAYAVAVAVDGEPEAGASLGEAIGGGARLARSVDERHALAGDQRPAHDPDREQLRAQRARIQLDVARAGLERGVAGRIGALDLRRAPAPEGRHLQEDLAVPRDAERAHLEDQPEATRAAGLHPCRTLRCGLEPRAPAAVRRAALRVPVFLEHPGDVELGGGRHVGGPRLRRRRLRRLLCRALGRGLAAGERRERDPGGERHEPSGRSQILGLRSTGSRVQDSGGDAASFSSDPVFRRGMRRPGTAQGRRAPAAGRERLARGLRYRGMGCVQPCAKTGWWYGSSRGSPTP